jgi:uncharacterized integral membrane protein (TIGR00698 family)
MPDLMQYTYKRALSPLRQVWPGVVLSFTIAMAATFISDHHGGPTLLYALLVGMAFHFLSKGTAVAAGINFTARTILRIGVALIGIRISTGQIAQLGAIPVLLVIVGVPATLIVGRFLAPSLGLTSSQGILTGGAVAICGVSAALAISSVLPKTKDSERDTLFTAIAVTLIGMVAMVCYPAIAHVIGLDTSATGILLGASIHDVSQVVGAGLLVSDQAGIVATYVKLLRVTMLVPVVLGLAWIFAPDKQDSSPNRQPLLPFFLIAFALLAAANSMGLVPRAVVDPLAVGSRWCLVASMAALGMKTSIEDLTKIGSRAVILVGAETAFLLLLVVGVLLGQARV